MAGGGMRVAYQAGVIRALLEHGLTFGYADGTSGGTMNLAMLYSGLGPEEMCARWRGLDVHRFFSPLPAAQYLKLLGQPAFGNADGVTKYVFPHLGIDVDQVRAAVGVRGSFNVCEFTTKTLVSVPHDQLTPNLLVAGVSLPILLPAVPERGRMFTDAVWIKDANLLDAVRHGANELWLVWCIGNTPEYRDGVLNQYVHMIEMSAHGGLFEEFDRIREINERIAGGEPVYGHTEPVTLHVVKPRYPLPLDTELYLGGIDTGTLIDMGYADATGYLGSMTPAGVPLQPAVTQMESAFPGLSFRETMSGPFALGTVDPEAGRTHGEAVGTRLTLHAAIVVRGMDHFLADGQHTGAMSARIDFGPFGEGIPAKRAVFKLFAPTPESNLKLMVYEMAFAWQGKDYYLAGRKEVRHDHGPDLWADTTTLRTQLHDGPDASGPVIGSGILRLGVPELIQLSLSLRVNDAGSVLQSAMLLEAFGRFFLGELWGPYAPAWIKSARGGRRLWNWLRRR